MCSDSTSNDVEVRGAVRGSTDEPQRSCAPRKEQRAVVGNGGTLIFRLHEFGYGENSRTHGLACAGPGRCTVYECRCVVKPCNSGPGPATGTSTRSSHHAGEHSTLPTSGAHWMQMDAETFRTPRTQGLQGMPPAPYISRPTGPSCNFPTFISVRL